MDRNTGATIKVNASHSISAERAKGFKAQSFWATVYDRWAQYSYFVVFNIPLKDFHSLRGEQ